ncbi:MAG TPA: hypothetical protein VFE58_17650 [Tepidisphaeraceae bacterium]|jgi:hypothetical protein|nr:hypothetical protein [Tepidisphaeraceae bacterium]
MKLMRSMAGLGLMMAAMLAGCSQPEPKYGHEEKLFLPGTHAQIWAVAPAVNISGQTEVDPLLQADMLFSQLQQVKGLTVIPVNRVVEVYAAMRITRVQSEKEAAEVCDALGCDALVVPTVTLYDPYDPPKFGGAIQVFLRHPNGEKAGAVDAHALTEQASASAGASATSLPRRSNFVQVADIYDAQNGTVRDKLEAYVAGRFDPKGPLKAKEYLASMDRYVGFAYHDLIVTLLSRPQMNPM